MRFSLIEFSGGLGDIGTFIPLTLALVYSTGMSLTPILILAGLFNIWAGLYFGQPIPLQPMKAIAAVAIAESLSASEVAAAGLIVGVIFVIIGFTGLAKRVEELVPRSLIRGIQLGVGAKLALHGFGMAAQQPLLGFDSLLTAILLGLAILILAPKRRLPVAAGLLLIGLVGAALALEPDSPLALSWPTLSFNLPSLPAFYSGFTKAALPQLPLTLLNSVLAVCALSGDLFPERPLPAQKMARSIGLMNLIIAPLGGMPVCHGSGGLAAQHFFGARTGGAVVMLGLLLLLVGLFFGGPGGLLLSLFPASILGVMLIFAGVELALPARDQRKRADFFIMLLTALGILAANAAVGFIIGLAAYLAHKLIRTTPRP